MRKYILEAQANGVKVFVCSPVPFCRFENGKVQRNPDSYPLWAKQVAIQTGAFFIDLNEFTTQVYDKLGQEEVKKMYFTSKDNVHTNEAGAILNAQSVIKGIRKIKNSGLRRYIL
jgi:lysophospholipase L1-like esterase